MRARLKVVPLCALVWTLMLPWHAAAQAATGGLSDYELDVEAPEEGFAYEEPLPAAAAKEFVLTGVGDYNYQDEQGRYVVDLLEHAEANIGVRITTPEGRPIVGAVPNISTQGSSRLVLSELSSAVDGVVRFGVVGGQMGLDSVVVDVEDASVEFAINVISLRAQGIPEAPGAEGAIAWSELLQAQVEYKESKMVSFFPDNIREKAGKTARIAGFMMPLEPDVKQKRFLLTSNPPSCFFHVPGGPAGFIEVLAPEGIEASWDHVVVEGRFEPQESSEIGVVYQLHDAELVTQ